MLLLYQLVRSLLSEQVGLAGNLSTSRVLNFVILSEFSQILIIFWQLPGN